MRRHAGASSCVARSSEDVDPTDLIDVPPRSLHEFYLFAKQTYDRGELRSFKVLIRLMRRYYGRMRAADIGPKKLRSLRAEMIRGDDQTDPPRKPWSRKYINQQVQRVRRIFKWAAGQELLSALARISHRME